MDDSRKKGGIWAIGYMRDSKAVIYTEKDVLKVESGGLSTKKVGAAHCAWSFSVRRTS